MHPMYGTMQNISMSHASIQLLKKHALKVTPARVAVLAAFSALCKPMSAEELFQELARKKINLVTIYRTIHAFEEAHILRRLDLHQDAVRYELAHHHHHHITCTQCGLIEEFAACDMAYVSKEVLKTSKAFKAVHEHSLELFSVCEVCKKK